MARRETFMPRLREMFEGQDLSPAATICERVGLPFAPILRPDQLFDEEHRTAAKVIEALEKQDVDIHSKVGGTGVVASLKVGSSERTIGLRADMDALPIQEKTGLPYASCHPGVFHGCGHDGHITMLLGTVSGSIK